VKRTARSWGVAALAAAAVLVPLGTTIATAAETANAPAANFEGATVPTDLGDASAQHYGGTPAHVSEFPGIIGGLRAGGPRPEGQTCTGTLVAPTKVLIAAHCADAAGEKTFVYGLDDLKQYAGGSGTGFQASKVVSYKKHPKYVNFDQGYDVAVVTLEKSITLLGGASFPTYATSADANDVLIGKTGLSYGYGKKDFNDTTKDVTLTKANMPIVNGDSVCQGVGAGFKSATMICAGDPNGNPTILPGDSGGPLVVNNKIYGVASWSRSDFKWYGVWGRLNNDMGDWVKTEVGTTPVPTDFSLSASPASGSVKAGSYISSTVTTVAGSGGAENLKLTASGVPSGVQAVFQPTDVAAGGTAKVTFDASTSAQNGTYNVTITGTNAGGKTATTAYSLTVTDGGNPTGDFKVTIDPSSLTINAGAGASTALSSVVGAGGAEQIKLTASGAPSGATVSFAPDTIQTGDGSKVIVESASTTPAGTYTVSITGTNTGGKTSTATLSLTVQGDTVPADFKVAVNPSSLTVAKNASVSAGVTTTAGQGGAENINLTASGLPTEAQATFQPSSVQTGAPAKLSIKTAATTPSGTYTVTVTGTNSGGKTATATLSLKVEGTDPPPPGDVKVTLSPSSGTAQQGQIAQFNASATGGTGKLTLTASGVPAGAQVFFNPASINQGASSLIWVFTNFQTPAGTHPITIKATSADGKSGTATYTLTVTAFGFPMGSAGRI